MVPEEEEEEEFYSASGISERSIVMRI